ncbi:hypothetical protein [Rhodococcoides fascians]|uniref:hypothetical protein n=1 Tax=Rhodococcoides fascians TaxID=1828 RepID=UPI001D36EC33|nr:hypothetical protein [Rhodococcus fascians]CAH0302353.1 hypothetical protein SRABI91_04592 [Rhodococcus fascians]
MAFHQIPFHSLRVGDRINRDIGSETQYTVVQIDESNPASFLLRDEKGEDQWTTFTPGWPVNLIYKQGSPEADRQ